MDPEFSKVLLSVSVKKRPGKINFEDVEVEAKNGDLGLGHGQGSKRSLFVTEDFAKEDGELKMHHHQETYDADALLLAG